MKKFFIVLLLCMVLISACQMQIPGEKKVEPEPETETISEFILDASTISSQDMIIDADSVISINNIEDGDFIVLSNPEFVKKTDKVRFISRASKQKEGTVLKTDNNTFIPYPDETSNSAVFYGEDLGVADNEVVKVHAKKLKKINTTDWLTADMSPQEGVNFCTKKTDTMELYEGIIAIDLRPFNGKEKKNMVLHMFNEGAGTLSFTSRSSDFGIIDPNRWEKRSREAHQVLDMTGSGNTLYVYISFSFRDFDTASGKTVEEWHKHVTEDNIPKSTTRLLPLHELSTESGEVSCNDITAFLIDASKLNSNNRYALKCPNIKEKNLREFYREEIRELHSTIDPRTRSGASFPYFLPVVYDENFGYIYFGKITEDMFFTNESFIDDGRKIQLVEWHSDEMPLPITSEYLGHCFPVDSGSWSFIFDDYEAFSSAESNYSLLIEFFEDSEGERELRDDASIDFTEKSEYNDLMIGNAGCSAQNDEINRTIKFENGCYPVGGKVENDTNGTIYMKITKKIEE